MSQQLDLFIKDIDDAVEALKRELHLLPSEIRRMGGIEKIKADNPGVVVKVRRMMQP